MGKLPISKKFLMVLHVKVYFIMVGKINIKLLVHGIILNNSK